MTDYWELIEPYLETINIYDGPDVFAASIANVPRPATILYAAHMCSSEVHNGGFLQLFWNSTGVLVPEAIEGFTAIGTHVLADITLKASLPLGSPYPRDRKDRWDSLLTASELDSKEWERIYNSQKDRYQAFHEAAKALPFDILQRQFWEQAKTENGGFETAADKYAQSLNLGH